MINVAAFVGAVCACVAAAGPADFFDSDDTPSISVRCGR